MAKRAKKRVKQATSVKKVSKKKTASHKTAAKKRSIKKTATKKKTANRKSTRQLKKPLSNHESLWNAYKSLQKRVDIAWDALQKDVKKKASADVITAHKNQLLLLLGECNYMARECTKTAGEPEEREYTSPKISQTTAINTDNNPFKNSSNK